MRMPYSITCLDIWGEDVKGNPLVFEQGDVDGECEPTGPRLPADELARARRRRSCRSGC